MKVLDVLVERKQVGLLYHFTKVENLGGIIASGLRPSYNSKYGDTVSFTRSKRMSTDIDYMGLNVVRLTIDGDALSSNNRLVAYSDNNMDEDEMETVLIAKNSNPVDVNRFIKAIDVLRDDEVDYDMLGRGIAVAKRKGFEVKVVDSW